MDTQECPSLTACPFFNNMKLPATARVLKNLYCKVRYERCLRYQMKQRGEEVPEKLWPNNRQLVTSNM